MKKIAFTLLILVGTLTMQASPASPEGDGSEYTYLTFEMTDGAKTSVDVSSLPVTINLDNSTLTIGSQTFVLADLSKMYFSTQDETQSETTGIEPLSISPEGESTEASPRGGLVGVFYDLQGRRVTNAQMRRGIYVMKTKQGTRKVNVK